MKKILLITLIVLPIYLLISLYFLDKVYFLSPIEYKNNIIIRNDSRGNGAFAAKRRGGRSHRGVDLLAKMGIPVLAVRSGRVTAAEQNRGMGKYVSIRHAGNITTIYGHLSGISVRKNNFVRQGQVIGQVGKTGNANHPHMQPHLHFEVRKNATPVDPLEYLN